MRLLGRLLAVVGLVAAGGLILPGGAAQAAACSGTSGVTVVIDYGSTSRTVCASDASSAGAVLASVAPVEYVAMYGKGVVCKISGVPSSQTCQRMPPTSAYWAFFHAKRGGSWIYSSEGVAAYDPAPGTVIGFAFGSGGTPSSPPPAAVAAPKPTPKPSPSSSSPTRRASGNSPAAPRTTSATTPRGSTSVRPQGTTGTAPSKPTTSSTTSTSAAPATSATATGPDGTTTQGGESTGATAAAAATTDSNGSTGTLVAGIGLVTLVGAGAAYLAVRRRAHG